MAQKGGGGAGAVVASSTGQQGQRLAVINEKLMRECIYLPGAVHPGVGPSDDMGRGGAGGAGLLGKAKADKRLGHAGGQHQQAEKASERIELHEVECLMFSFRSIGQISNLVGVDKLTRLHLDNNAIQTIEGLGHLVHLKWLDLSFNKIKEIEGLDELTSLENLSLYKNKISQVKGLESLTELTCLSLGENEVENLDDVARYLHRFKKLRMLTLKGNPLDQHNQYRARIISYVRHIKFFDHRLVRPDEITRARESDENVRTIEDEDKKEEDLAAVKAEEERQAASFVATNCPNPNTFFQEVYHAKTESSGGGGGSDSSNSRSIANTLDCEAAHERLQQTKDKFRDDFNSKLKDIVDKMKEIKEKKDVDERDFAETYARAKNQCNEECKKLIHQFEKKLKRVIPFGLKARPDDNFDERQTQELRNELGKLQTALLEKEADQYDAYESLIESYDKVLKHHQSDVTEVLTGSFDELKSIKVAFQQELRRRFDEMSDERQKQMQDADASYGISSSSMDNNKDRDFFRLIETKDEYPKILQEWAEAQNKRIDDTEEMHRKEEENRATTRYKQALAAEHARNRARVCEINEYVNLTLKTIADWENLANGE